MKPQLCESQQVVQAKVSEAYIFPSSHGFDTGTLRGKRGIESPTVFFLIVTHYFMLTGITSELISECVIGWFVA